MKLYRVKDWDAHYENNKSRERDECSFVCVPNKQHGLGFLRVITEKDGASIYGIFNLIIGACSRQRRPRSGWLTDDGTDTGVPWTVDDLAMRWRRPAGEITRAIDVLCSERVDWIEQADIAAETSDVGPLNNGARVVPGECPHDAPEGKGREEKRKKECSEASTPSPPDDPAIVQFPEFPTVGERKTWLLTDSHIEELSATFPAPNVPFECRKAHGWVKANLKRRKTYDGMNKFLFCWLSRAQNEARPNGENAPTFSKHPGNRRHCS